tara:strand:- start:15 stop:896 length:882 start_codon:yes stop_codon:yes gene_type:complete
MNKMTLVIMAAGLGSRYGGLKQLDAVGPNGETIIDYSIFDAIQAGFSKVVFVIRKEFEDDFRHQMSARYAGQIEMEFALQDLSDLPRGFVCPTTRSKPWGTGHALLSAQKYINEPFAVINGDDFYGRKSFYAIAQHYSGGALGTSMVGFRLENTLSQFGGVSRGVCTVGQNKLHDVRELHGVQREDSTIVSHCGARLTGGEVVSMNMWGFVPAVLPLLRFEFETFLRKEGAHLASEFLIPTVVNGLIKKGDLGVEVINSSATWFGVTYQEDRPYVVGEIRKLVEQGVYPPRLY